MAKRLLKIKAAADMLGVNPETLRRWDRSGRLKANKINDRGDRRYPLDVIKEFIKESKK